MRGTPATAQQGPKKFGNSASSRERSKLRLSFTTHLAKYTRGETRAMPHGDILGFAPPLIITRDEIDIIVDATAKSVDTTYRALKAEGAV